MACTTEIGVVVDQKEPEESSSMSTRGAAVVQRGRSCGIIVISSIGKWNGSNNNQPQQLLSYRSGVEYMETVEVENCAHFFCDKSQQRNAFSRSHFVRANPPSGSRTATMTLTVILGASLGYQ